MFDAAVVFIAVTQIILRGGISLFGGFAVPFYRLFVVLFDALAVFVAVTQITLRCGISLFGGFAEPFRRLLVILFDAAAVFIANAQVVLCVGIPLFGGFSQRLDVVFGGALLIVFSDVRISRFGIRFPAALGKTVRRFYGVRFFPDPGKEDRRFFGILSRLLFENGVESVQRGPRAVARPFDGPAGPIQRCVGVFFDSFPLHIAIAETAHCVGIPLIGGLAEPFDRFDVVLFDAVAVEIALAQLVLRLGVPQFGGPTERFRRVFRGAAVIRFVRVEEFQDTPGGFESLLGGESEPLGRFGETLLRDGAHF